MPFKGEVIADDSGKWCGNACVFGSEAEASSYIADLYRRWTAVRSTRVTETDAQVNYTWSKGKLGPVVAPQLVTVAEAAEYLRVSKRTVQRLIAAGNIKAVKVGAMLRIPIDQLPARTMP